MNKEKINSNSKKVSAQLDKWETPVLLELDASLSESMSFTSALDGDGGPKPS